MADSTEREYLVVSAPKTSGDTFGTLARRVQTEQDLGRAFKFAVPDLKVGTLDSLMALSDELHKVDSFVEGVTRKVAQTRFDAWEEGDGSAAGAQYNLNVNGRTMDDFLTFFQWDDAKYPSTHSLKALVSLIHSQVGKLDEELKVRQPISVLALFRVWLRVFSSYRRGC
jgi:V-type H+-transporting ATPase subunit C